MFKNEYVATISLISIYTLSDLGDLSNLIGSLSRIIQQYSPPSEWIMCELSVFPIFLENDLLKVDKILAWPFLRQDKTFKRIQNDIFPLTIATFCAWWIVYNSCLFTQKRPSPELSISQQENLTQKSKFIYDKKITLTANDWRKSTF